MALNVASARDDGSWTSGSLCLPSGFPALMLPVKLEYHPDVLEMHGPFNAQSFPLASGLTHTIRMPRNCRIRYAFHRLERKRIQWQRQVVQWYTAAVDISVWGIST